MKSPTSIVVSPVMLKKQESLQHVFASDLVLITVMAGHKLPLIGLWLDECLDNQLSTQLREQAFNGQRGQSCLLAVSQHAVSPGQAVTPNVCRLKHVLVVGLGNFREFHSHTLCGLIRMTLEVAAANKAEKLCIPIAPNRMSSNTISLSGTGAVLNCRLWQSSLNGTVPSEIEILCSPQAKPHIEKGLSVTEPRCNPCRHPQLPIIEL